MRISKIHLKNFKRFTDLLIDNIPAESKLVLLIGNNGSGKSSVFDAFGYIDGSIKKDVNKSYEFFDYYRKKMNEIVSVEIMLDNKENYFFTDINFNNTRNLNSQTFYGRTSFRQIARLTRTALGQSNNEDVIAKDSDRPKSFIDRDNRFENDVERITGTILKSYFDLRLLMKKLNRSTLILLILHCKYFRT